MIAVPPEQVGDFIINNALAVLGPHWGKHPDWEDIRAEAHLKAWTSYRRAQENQGCRPTTAAIYALAWGPAAWFARDPGWAKMQFPLLMGGCVEDGFVPSSEGAAATAEKALHPALLTADFTDEIITRLDAVALTQRVLSQLPAPQEAVMVLHWGEGLTLAETAARLGCPLGTVHSRLRSGLQRCREILGLAPASLPKRERAAPNDRGARQHPATCPAGHPWVPENWIVYANGHRHCRLCRETPKPLCEHGHPLTAANSYFDRGTPRCLTCRRLANRRHDAKRRPKQAAPPPRPAGAKRSPRPAWRSTEANRLYMREYRRRQKEEPPCSSP